MPSKRLDRAVELGVTVDGAQPAVPRSLAHGRAAGEEMAASGFASDFKLDAAGENAALPIKEAAFRNALELRPQLV